MTPGFSTNTRAWGGGKKGAAIAAAKEEEIKV